MCMFNGNNEDEFEKSHVIEGGQGVARNHGEYSDREGRDFEPNVAKDTF